MKSLISSLLGVTAGFVIAKLGSFLLGYTAAIPAPQAWFQWFNQTLGTYAGLVSWELLVVQFPGVGILAWLISFAMVRYSQLPWWQTALFIMTGEWLVVFAQNPLNTALPGLFLFQRAHEIVVFSCILHAAWFASHHKARTSTRTEAGNTV